MTFDRLARELDSAYSDGIAETKWAMRNFGAKHEHDLREIMTSGHTLADLADVAKIGDYTFWADFIRKGMGISAYRRMGKA